MAFMCHKFSDKNFFYKMLHSSRPLHVVVFCIVCICSLYVQWEKLVE